MNKSEFNEILTQLDKDYTAIKTKITERKELQNKRLGTSQKDNEIKSIFNKSICQIKSLMLSQTSKSSKVTLKESNFRLSELQKISRKLEELKQSYEEDLYRHLSFQNEQKDKNNIEQMSNGDIVQITREKMNQQEELLDELHNLLTVTKENSKEMNNELGKQKPMLTNLDSDMDSVQLKVDATAKKMDNYEHKSSNCGLIAIIWFEIILMIFIIIAY